MPEKKLSREELQEFYDRANESPYYKPYMTLIKKMYEVCESFDDTKIDIIGEDATFKNYTEFSKNIRKIVEDMDGMRAKLNPAEAAKAKAKEKELKMNPFALENMIKARD